MADRISNTCFVLRLFPLEYESVCTVASQSGELTIARMAHKRAAAIGKFALGINRRAAGVAALRSLALAAIVAGLLIRAAPALAQNQYSSTSMWGSAPGGVSVSGSLESASAHYFNGIVAGQVNSARNGMLTDGTSLSIQTIGSQNITSMTVNGSGNENLQIDAAQDSTNSGDVTAESTIESNW